jgi:hypothetical protein
LDGSKILSSLLPGRMAYQYESIGQYGPFILMGLVYLGVIGAITYPLELVLSYLINSIVMVIL